MSIQQSNLESRNATHVSAPSTFTAVKIPKRSGTTTRIPDRSLVTCLARAFYWQKLLDEGVARSGSDIAKHENLDASTVNELLRLTLLDPCIVNDIMSGDQPERLTSLWFTRYALPVEWRVQQILIEQLRTVHDGIVDSGDFHDQT